MIQIAVINESTAIADAAVAQMIPAFSTQWNRDLAQVWNLESATFEAVPKSSAVPPQYWQVVFLDNSDQAQALAYHDVTKAGMPLAKVFVKTIQGDGASVSVAAAHEICEMAVDPTINLAAQYGDFWAYEVCDPVEDDQYGYNIGGVIVTDFVTPAWFDYANSSGKQIDFMGHATAPFQVLTGGYAQKFVAGSGWQQVNGDKVTKAGALTAPVGSRRERRIRGQANWTRSAR